MLRVLKVEEVSKEILVTSQLDYKEVKPTQKVVKEFVYVVGTTIIDEQPCVEIKQTRASLIQWLQPAYTSKPDNFSTEMNNLMAVLFAANWELILNQMVICRV